MGQISTALVETEIVCAGNMEQRDPMVIVGIVNSSDVTNTSDYVM